MCAANTPNTLYIFMVWYLVKDKDNFTFINMKILKKQ
jgi:hypothetical protein